MRKHRGVLLPAAVALLTATTVAVAGVTAAAALYGDDFEDGDTSGWSKSGGTWAVVADGSKVLNQANAATANAREFSGDISWTDYTVAARVKPLSFGSGGFAGVLARASGSTTFYRLALLPGSVQLQAVKGSTVTVLGTANRTVATGSWYALALTVSGTTVSGTVDGVSVGSATSTVSTKGRIGLQTGSATASFDDVAVSSSTSSTPTPTATSTPTVSATSTIVPTTAPPTTVPATTVPATTVPATTVPAAAGLVVAPGGSDANPGTLAQPLASIQKAIDLAGAGGVISVRAGTYALTTNLQILKSGSSGKPITLTSYNGERVVIDGEGLPNTPAPVGASIPAAQRGVIHMEASYWKLYGLELVNGPYGLYCAGCNNNVFERLSTHDNYESGVQIQGASGNNLVLNLDSYLNRDPRKNGESADGLAIKEGSGSGNVVRGARLWNNVDDGFDAWEFLSPITIESTISYGNGVNRWGFADFAGDGNGFKLGGGDEVSPAAHVVRNSIAFSNTAHGFTDNSNPASMTLERNTAWKNTKTGFEFDATASVLTRNLAVGNGTAVSLGSSTGSGNSWNLSSIPALASTDASIITGPRAADGSIATSSFLRPANGADLGARI